MSETGASLQLEPAAEVSRNLRKADFETEADAIDLVDNLVNGDLHSLGYEHDLMDLHRLVYRGADRKRYYPNGLVDRLRDNLDELAHWHRERLGDAETRAMDFLEDHSGSLVIVRDDGLQSRITAVRQTEMQSTVHPSKLEIWAGSLAVATADSKLYCDISKLNGLI